MVEGYSPYWEAMIMALLSSPDEVLVSGFVIYVYYIYDNIDSLGNRMMQIMRGCVHLPVAVTKKQAFDCVLLLKKGSWSFECIIILLIYFLNCWKALFKRQKLSFNKKYRVKSIRLALLRKIPLLCTPVCAICISVPKFDTVDIAALHFGVIFIR